MSKLNEKELNKVCRTCLSSTKFTQSLYESSSSTLVSLADILMSFTALKCYANDGLPAQICDQCTSELNRLQTFQSKCLESDRILRNPVQIVKIEEMNHFEETVNPLTLTELEQNKTVKNRKFLRSNVANGSKMEIEHDDLDSVNAQIITAYTTKPLIKPLTTKELQNELNVDIDLIKHEIKTEIDDVNSINISKVNNQFSFNAKSLINNREKPYSCKFCASTFKKEATLMVHLRLHTGEKPYWQQAEKQYSCPENRESKITLTQQGKTQYSCPENRKSNITFTQQGETQYSCPETKKSKITLTQQRLRKRMEEKTYICKFCNTSFDHKESLTEHVATHTGKTPFLCIICDSTFTQRTSLMNHMRRHTGNRPYACTVCDSTFTIRSLLTVHMQLHTGEKPYPCTVCNRAFRQNYILNAHMRTHGEAKPFSCTVCDSSFKYKRCLTTHMWRHTGKKPYSCTVCDKSFSAREYFKVHMRKHSGENP